MADGGADKEIHYCYQCGTRIRPNLENCWYCGVAVHRTIRPVRRCPFCAEPIRAESIKCRHCGEFLDGRAKIEPQSVQQMVIIDKDAMRTLSSMPPSPTALPTSPTAQNLFGQRPAPMLDAEYTERGGGPRDARMLPDHIPAVDNDFPLGPGGQVTPASGRRALPAPEGTSAIVPRPTALPARAGDSGGGLMRRPTQLPARYEPQPLAPLQPTALPGAGAAAATADAAIDAEASDLYRQCEMCGAEALQSDNFCYHCGKKFHRTTKDARREAIERRRRFKQALKTFVLLLILAGIAAAAYFYIQGDLPLDRISEIKPAAERAIKGELSKALDELKTFDPKVIAVAGQCVKNLEQIQQAKTAAAAKQGPDVAEVSLDDVLKVSGSEKLPACPAGGTYTLNAVGRAPTCSIGDNGTSSTLDDHILPATRLR